jgi:hypothetical protein
MKSEITKRLIDTVLASDTNNGDQIIFTPQQLDLFAEMIVGECIARIESQITTGKNIDDWTVTRNFSHTRMIELLERHFGLNGKASPLSDSTLSVDEYLHIGDIDEY